MLNLTRREEYLSRENTQALKGVLAIAVFLSHLIPASGVFGTSILNTLFHMLGYLSVSLFFFLSGYGLMASYSKRKHEYVKKMPVEKILPFYCIIVFLVLLYQIFGLLIGDSFDWMRLIGSLTFGETIIANGWYLQVQLVLYILFFLVFGCVKDSAFKQIFTLGAVCILFIAVLIALGFSSTWYECIPSFLLGIVWYLHKKNIDKILGNNKRWFVLLSISFILFIALVLGGKLITLTYINIFLKTLSALTFAVFAMILIFNIPIKFSVANFLGKYSLEIYVMQGLFITLFHSGLVYIDNPYLYILLVSIFVIVFAITLNPIIKFIYSAWRKKNEHKT